MSEADVAITARNVSRMYKRYRHPRYRVMEAFRLPLPKNAYDEFWALRDISLELLRGDSLGIIGENGAGKSTLLNIICGRLRPTSGSVEVRGKLQALMDLGTGFHPELSGRENILSALAYQGVTGRRANDRLDEIVDFSELGEFINQPVKIYSSGMYARLAFSTATAIDPDVLIIDEVLGAGDAYFIGKCNERMQRLIREIGATVLFVSHDMAAVQRLCNRAIWIDHGSLRMAGDTLTLAKAYHAWVLERDEARLRAETSRSVTQGRANLAEANRAPSELLHFRLVSANGALPARSHPVRQIGLRLPDAEPIVISTGAPGASEAARAGYIVSDLSYTCWSSPREFAGQRVRCFEGGNSILPHAPIYFRPSNEGGLADATIEIEHATDPQEPVALELHDTSGYRRLGLLSSGGNGVWRTDRFPLAPGAAERGPGLDERVEPAATDTDLEVPRDIWDTREASFLEIWPCVPETLERKHIFALGEDIGFRIVVEARVDLPPLWLAAVIYDDLGNRTALLVDKTADPVLAGIHEFVLVIEAPTIRQSEYSLTFELLPHFDLFWKGKGRLPYLTMWDRRVHFKIDEDFHGTVNRGRVHLSTSLVSHRHLGESLAPFPPEETAAVADASDPA